MGFIDKLKNIFFEEEEEEEEYEERVPAKKEKEKEKEEIAKKVELPKKRQQARIIEEEFKESNEPKVVELSIPKKEEPKKITPKINTDLIFDDDDFVEQKTIVKKEPPKREIPKTVMPTYKIREKEVVNPSLRETKYEYSKTMVKKEAPKGFTPSPIISPIYGILDKNYKKEEVKEKKEIRISSRPIKMDLDSVRNKAFGDLEYDLLANAKDDYEVEMEEKEKKQKKKVYDTSKEDKPLIDKVTLGEADEYFQDLGLAYNTDYKDLSKDINDGKIKEKKESDHLEDNLFDLIDSMYDKED